jgi:hypothetical protein
VPNRASSGSRSRPARTRSAWPCSIATRGAGVDEIYSDFRVDAEFSRRRRQNVTILGPFNAKGAGDTPARKRIFTCKPATAAKNRMRADDSDDAGARAYRGPVSAPRSRR